MDFLQRHAIHILQISVCLEISAFYCFRFLSFFYLFLPSNFNLLISHNFSLVRCCFYVLINISQVISGTRLINVFVVFTRSILSTFYIFSKAITLKTLVDRYIQINELTGDVENEQVVN